MSESDVPALIVVATLLVIGVVLLIQRMAAKRSVRVKQLLKTTVMPSEPSSESRDSTQDQQSLERMLDGEVNRPVEPIAGPATSQSDTTTEQTFRNMFFTTADGGEGLIEYYMKRYQCDRTEAMRHAIKEREREARD